MLKAHRDLDTLIVLLRGAFAKLSRSFRVRVSLRGFCINPFAALSRRLIEISRANVQFKNGAPSTLGSSTLNISTFRTSVAQQAKARNFSVDSCAKEAFCWILDAFRASEPPRGGLRTLNASRAELSRTELSENGFRGALASFRDSGGSFRGSHFRKPFG